MKKMILILVAAWLPALAAAQTCVRDSNLLVTGDLFSPAPWTPDSPYYNLKPACINEPYQQSLTLNVPFTITFNGSTFPISSLSISTSGAIANLPAGLTYSCDPPNCVFNPGTLGCIQLYGTPNSNVTPDTFDLVLAGTISFQGIPIPVTLPGTIVSGAHYYLIVKPGGACVSSAGEAPGMFSLVRNLPNPFHDQTVIEVQSTQSGDFRFEVFDLLGNRLHTQSIQLSEGAGRFTFDAGQLPAGAFIYTIGNTAGKTVRRMVKL